MSVHDQAAALVAEALAAMPGFEWEDQDLDDCAHAAVTALEVAGWAPDVRNDNRGERARDMTTSRPLADAREELYECCQRADDAGDRRGYEFLESLYDVAESLCCIGQHPHDERACALEAGPLVSEMLGVRHATLQNLAGPGEDEREKLNEALHLERNLDAGINQVMWAIAGRRDGAQLLCSHVVDLLGALRDLVEWAERMAGVAVPDPELSNGLKRLRGGESHGG